MNGYQWKPARKRQSFVQSCLSWGGSVLKVQTQLGQLGHGHHGVVPRMAGYGGVSKSYSQVRCDVNSGKVQEGAGSSLTTSQGTASK